MKTYIGNNIKIVNPTKEVINYERDNLILDNPEYFKKQNMGFYLGNTPKKIYLFSIGEDYIVLPFGVLNDIWKLINKDYFHTDFIKPQYLHLEFNEDIKLYDYQEEALKNLLSKKGGILNAGCGGGKTFVGLSLIGKINQKALWITHTKRLLNQAKESAKRLFKKVNIGEITEGKIEIGEDITFATIQTLSKCDLNLINCFNVIVVDECHHIAGSPTNITMYYKVLNNLSARYKYGLSATLERSDGLIKSTYSLIGNISFKVNEIKHLKAHTKVIETQLDLYSCVDEFTNGDGTFNLNKYLYFLSVNSKRNKLIGENIKSLIGERSLQIVLTLRVEHAKRIYEELRGEDVILLTSKEKIKNNDYNHQIIVSTFQLFKEGVDIPRADTLHIIAPTSNNVFLVQSIGRIERIEENKKTPLIYFYNDEFYYNEKIKKKLLRLRP